MTKPEKTLTLLFLQRENEVLLAMKKRGFGEGRWNGVGGKVEEGESVEGAMIREAEEEIGVRPTKFGRAALLRFDEYFKGIPTIMNVHVFMGSEWDGEPQESDEMRPRWFSQDEIPYGQMWPDDPYWLPAVLAGQKVTADFELNLDDQIVSHDIRTVEHLPAEGV